MSGLHASRTGTLLGVWAHPDDEAFLSAGLMARALAAGDHVVVATATRGELGTPDPERWPPGRLARLREQELSRSLAVLGVTDHRWLGHHDGTLPDVDRATAVAQLVELIEEVRPDTVVTFGPEGLTGHGDHRTVSSWTTSAWWETGRASRLWYATVTPSFHRTWGDLNERVRLWFEGSRPPETPEAELAAQVVLDDDLAERKYQALRAHTSQMDGLVALVGEDRFRRWWAEESFVAAPDRTPHGSPPAEPWAMPVAAEASRAGR
jgi:LmbE family N-acetylglucosaminyl deacetylase